MINDYRKAVYWRGMVFRYGWLCTLGDYSLIVGFILTCLAWPPYGRKALARLVRRLEGHPTGASR